MFNTTGSGIYGESNSIFHKLENVTDIELATMSFGQRFTITPLQLVTAVSAISNEGVLMKPNIIKEIKNPNTGAVTTIEPTEVRQVISKETAEILMDMTEYVVTDGTGRYAKVTGYSVGGKSGTSEPIAGETDKGYVASFIGLSPTANTQVVVLVALFNPKGESYQGGQVAGPVVSQILSEVLPYLGVNSDTSSNTRNASVSSNTPIILPDVRNKTITEAKNALSNFDVHVPESEDANTTLVTEQLPKPGAYLLKNADIFLYTENNNAITSVTVPNLKGMSANQATNSLSSKNLNIIINGTGIVISQDIVAETEVPQGTIITVTLQNEIDGGY